MQQPIHTSIRLRVLLGCLLLCVLAPSGLAQVLPSQTDSLIIDTTLTQKDVAIRTTVLDPQMLEQNREYRKKLQFHLKDLLYPDLLTRLDGFQTTLGQIGKPYRRYRYGVDASLFRNSHFHNPFTGQENIYMINAQTEVPYFDTRTPFINAYYGQGKADLAQLRVDVSQSVTPFLNLAVMYYRRNSTGVYSNFATDQNNIGVGGNFRTKDDRYHVFGNFVYQEHNEQINGGSSQQFINYEDLFQKSSQPVALSDALLLRVQRSIYGKQYFRVTNDTTNNPHTVRIFNSVQYQQFENEFTDSLIDEEIQSWQFPVYPTLYADAFLVDSSFIYEKFYSQRTIYTEGFSYKLETPFFGMNHRVGATNEIVKFEKNLRNFRQTKFERWWEGDTELRAIPFALGGDWRLKRITNNFFGPELFLEGGVRFDFPKLVVDYERKEPHEFHPKDSITITRTHRPFSLFARAVSNDRNPTLQQAFGEGFQNITFEADRGLRNQQMTNLRAGIEWRSKDKYNDLGVTKGMHIRLTAFRSQMRNMIWYDSTMALQQFSNGVHLQWQGVEADIRLRLGKFFLESTTVFQQSSSNVQDVVDQLDFFQPWLYGRARLYFENKDLSFAAIVRAGVEVHYHLDFNAPLFDPVSQQFYPQTETITPGYQRIDVFAGTQVKKAYIYLKLVNWNEGLFGYFLPGYFTTQQYPMRDLNFVVGVNWSFFD